MRECKKSDRIARKSTWYLSNCRQRCTLALVPKQRCANVVAEEAQKWTTLAPQGFNWVLMRPTFKKSISNAFQEISSVATAGFRDPCDLLAASIALGGKHWETVCLPGGLCGGGSEWHCAVYWAEFATLVAGGPKARNFWGETPASF